MLAVHSYRTEGRRSAGCASARYLRSARSRPRPCPLINDVALLVNPAAGSGRGRRVGASAAALPRESVAVRELAGTGIDDAAVFARRAVRDGCGALVICGGDGIVHVALQAVGAALGIIPAGSGNEFARAAGVPAR